MPLPEPLNSADLQRFLENPEQLAAENRELQLAIANYPTTPRLLLEVLAQSTDPQVAQTARLHVNWAGELTQNWQEAVDAELRNMQLGQNDRLAVELLKFAPVPDYFLSAWVPAQKFIEALRNPHLPLRYRIKLLERLAKEPTIEPRLQVAESSETPLAVLEQLAGDLEMPIRLAVKYNPNCPPGLIDLVEGQHTVANDWNTDAEQLTMLGQSRWAWIRLTVAQNPSIPLETLMQLALDSTFKVQLAVAKNPQTPANVLAILAEHLEETIQEAIAEHPNATEEILLQLFPNQRDILKNRQNLPLSILERFFREYATDKPLWKQYELQYLLLEQSNTPTWILDRLANVDLEEVRADKLANQENFEIGETIEDWIRDALKFLINIARHPQVTREILERISHYPNPNVKLAVAQNYLTPESLKMQLLEELSVNLDEEVQVKVAEAANTPISTLEVMARNEFYQTKLLREIRRTLSSEYAANANSFKSVADKMISDLKHEILYPANIRVDVDRWMEIIQRSGVLEESFISSLDEDDYHDWSLDEYDSYYDGEQSGNRIEQAIPLWTEVLPGLSLQELKRAVRRIFDVLDMIDNTLRNNSAARSVAVALVGNPNTPETLREVLKNQLIRPSKSLDSYDSDRDIFLALAYNSAIPEAERRQYLQPFITQGYMGKIIAEDPRTPLNILEQLLEQGQEEAIAKNPATPEYLLRRIADKPLPHDWILRVIAENPNAPADLLIRFVKQPHEKRTSSNVSMLDLVLRNPNLPILERYRLLLEKEQGQENAKAHELMSRRPNSPYGLAEVVKSGDKQAIYNAARNSLTPIPILEQLARYPDETVRGVLLENRNLPLEIRLELTRDRSVSVRCGLARKNPHRETPVQVLEILADDESEQVREFVAENPYTPIQVLEKLANDPSPKVKQKLVTNQNTPVTILNRLGLEEDIFNVRNPNTPGIVLAHAVNKILERGYKRDENLVEFLKHPINGSQMPASTLEQLANYNNNSVRYEVAAHPNTPISTLEKLSRESYVPTARAVASNRNTPAHVLEQLATHPDYTTRYNVAHNRNTSPRALELLARYQESQTNAPSTTKDALKSMMAGGDNNEIRKIVAGNPNTPVTVLEWLATREFVNQEETRQEPDPLFGPRTPEEVLYSLVYNPSLTPEILARLAIDPSPKIRALLIRHPNMTPELWEQLAQDEDVEVRYAIASATNCPISILQTLASDEVENVRLKIASNANTPANTLELLCQDVDAKVREAIASNPNTTSSVLEQLAQDEKVEVRRAVAKNSNTPATIRESLRELVIQPSTRQSSPTLQGLSRIYIPNTDDLPTLLSEYVQSPNAFVRFVALLHPLTPVDSLQEGFQSLFWIDRYAVADNPSTPVEIRQQLAQDCNRIVRATAKSYLQNL
ncbi:hypothetical protein ACE1CI_18170 [Aerosakkonemataceae cyanobacterium BLCC-F50]|uniref:Leucine rich repeat variant n=1 Tax=Floridaenema flaviceps BLCC-F50 TaxID=3153642 RepID=A0ABV4XSZ2_9CYAN